MLISVHIFILKTKKNIEKKKIIEALVMDIKYNKFKFSYDAFQERTSEKPHLKTCDPHHL